MCVFKVSLKEWGWEMELTLQDDIGAVNFKTVSVCVALTYIAFTTFNILVMKISHNMRSYM